MKIIQNKIKCLKCGDIIESEHRHDFVWCKCKSVAVDGGKDYLKRIGSSNNTEDLSYSEYELGDVVLFEDENKYMIVKATVENNYGEFGVLKLSGHRDDGLLRVDYNSDSIENLIKKCEESFGEVVDVDDRGYVNCL